MSQASEAMSIKENYSKDTYERRSYDSMMQQAQTEIAILKVHVTTLEDKLEEVKSEIKTLRDHIDKNADNMYHLMKEFQKTSADAHKQMADKISSLERWRWMMMGAGIILGSMGLEAVKALFVVS